MDKLAEFQACVDFFLVRPVSAVDDKAYIGNYAQQMVRIAPVERESIVIAGGKQDFGPRSLALNLLLLVESVPDGFVVLLEYQFVKYGQVGGIIAHRIFNQKDGPGAHLKYVVVGIQTVFQEFDDGDYDIRVVVPAEDIIYE